MTEEQWVTLATVLVVLCIGFAITLIAVWGSFKISNKMDREEKE